MYCLKQHATPFKMLPRKGLIIDLQISIFHPVKNPLDVKDKPVQKILEEIGEKLRDLRKKKGYTSAETFAYDYDLPRVHYWRIERGKVNMTIQSLQRLLSIHKISFEDFFSDIGR